MVYTASSLSLAALEVLVHLPPTMRRTGGMPPFVAVAIDVPDGQIAEPGLGVDQDEQFTRAIGDAWLKQSASLAMRVPSRVIPLELNVLLNPRHPAMARVTVALTQPFVFDDRLTY